MPNLKWESNWVLREGLWCLGRERYLSVRLLTHSCSGQSVLRHFWEYFIPEPVFSVLVFGLLRPSTGHFYLCGGYLGHIIFSHNLFLN